MKSFFLLLLPLTLVGCMSSITNLTPSRMARSSDGTYRVEASWSTREHAIREETITPLVMVGTDFFPMTPEKVVSDRWEAFVPVPADKVLLHYRFKFDFTRDAISAPISDSKLSQEYTLEILDKPSGK